jgi:IS5 family transposase
MNKLVLWAELCAVVEPYYPKRGNGRPPIALERMLRIHFVQHWFNLADLACEEALYDSLSLRRFVGIDLGSETVPDATTLLKFRHLLEEQKLGERIFAEVGRVLQARGAKLKSGRFLHRRSPPIRRPPGWIARSRSALGLDDAYLKRRAGHLNVTPIGWEPSHGCIRR